MKKVSDELIIATDDGSYGRKGFVTHMLEEVLHNDPNWDLVFTVGPPIMMKLICEITKHHNIKTIVSLNPIMVDGTGMCGACRVNVGGEIKFACVDGPDFDGHQVDFDELMRRLTAYKQYEKEALDKFVRERGLRI